MSMTEFEKAQLALMEKQIEAQNANTRALLALKAPEMTPDERSAKELAIMRRGGPPVPQADFEGVGFFVGKCGEPTPQVNLRGRFNTSGPRDGLCIEVSEDDAGRELVIAWVRAKFDREHPHLVIEAASDPERRAHYEKERERKCGHAFYFDFRLPMIRQVVGKTRSDSRHMVKWAEAPVWTSGPAETTTAPEAQQPD